MRAILCSGFVALTLACRKMSIRQTHHVSASSGLICETLALLGLTRTQEFRKLLDAVARNVPGFRRPRRHMVAARIHADAAAFCTCRRPSPWRCPRAGAPA